MTWKRFILGAVIEVVAVEVVRTLTRDALKKVGL